MVLAKSSVHSSSLEQSVSLQCIILLKCMIVLSIIQNGNAVMDGEGTSWCLLSWKWRQHCLFVYFVLYTNKNTLKMKPWCNDDLKRNDTLSHNIVLSNSPELPKRLYSKSRRNQMREKSITFLSPLSLPWLNYWNKMLHLEESLERQREREREVGERETLLGTWVPFRLGPSSLRKPLKAVNDPLPVPGWEAVSLLWLSEYRIYTQVWGHSKIIKKNINF